MKTAIPSEGYFQNSKMDKRFGRCSVFAIYDSVSGETQFLSNPSKDASGGAGPAAVQYLADLGIDKLVVSELGGKALAIVEKLKMEVSYDSDKTISEIIDSL